MLLFTLACTDPAVPEGSENAADCHDGFDNDGDGAPDCEDSDCLAVRDCTQTEDTGDSGNVLPPREDTGTTTVEVVDMFDFLPPEEREQAFQDEVIHRVVEVGEANFEFSFSRDDEVLFAFQAEADEDRGWVVHTISGTESSWEGEVLLFPREQFVGMGHDDGNGVEGIESATFELGDCDVGSFGGECLFIETGAWGGLEAIGGLWVLGGKTGIVVAELEVGQFVSD